MLRLVLCISGQYWKQSAENYTCTYIAQLGIERKEFPKNPWHFRLCLLGSSLHVRYETRVLQKYSLIVRFSNSCTVFVCFNTSFMLHFSNVRFRCAARNEKAQSGLRWWMRVEFNEKSILIIEKMSIFDIFCSDGKSTTFARGRDAIFCFKIELIMIRYRALHVKLIWHY